MIVKRRFEFEAAHSLPAHPGKCRELHGHSYVLTVSVDGKVNDDTGLVIDFSDLKRIVIERVVSLLDHKCVNEVIENPTSERMAGWMWQRLREELPGLAEVELYETRSCSVIYRGD